METARPRSATFGLVVENESADTGALMVTVTVNALNAAGDAIGTTTADVNVIPAGDKFNVGGDIDVGDEMIDSLEIDAENEEEDDSGQFAVPEVSKVRVERGEFGDVSVRAQVENPLESDLSELTDCFAVLRDADGDIVGGSLTFPNNAIKPGRKAAIEFSFFDPPAGLDSADVSVDNEVN